MIYIPLQRTLQWTFDITNLDITEEQQQSINQSLKLYNHQKNLLINSYIKAPLHLAVAVLQPWKSNLPFGIDIPLLPYV